MLRKNKMPEDKFEKLMMKMKTKTEPKEFDSLSKQIDTANRKLDGIDDLIDKSINESSNIFESKIVDRTNQFITKIASNMKGDKGDDGELTLCKNFEDGFEVKRLGLVTHKSGVWQAVNDTDREPSIYDDNWKLISNGIDKVYTDIVIDELRLFVIDSASTKKDFSLDYPLINPCGTWEEKEQYHFFDTVMKDGHSWVASIENPKGNPCKSDDWQMLSMRGGKGSKGDKGDMPEMDSIIKALAVSEIAGGNSPIRNYAGKWVYNEPTQSGSLITFNSGLWLCVNNDSGNTPISDINNKNFVFLFIISKYFDGYILRKGIWENFNSGRLCIFII